MRRSLLIAFALATSACSQPANNGVVDENNASCTTGKCDDGGKRNLFTELEGRNEPAAEFLRKAGYEDGTIDADYFGFLDGIGEELGCDQTTEKTFTILMSKHGFFPRNMTTRCSADAVKASQFFISTQSDVGGLTDLNPRDFKLFAWDNDARKYNTYEVKGDGSGEGRLFVDVEPDHCNACHTNPLHMSDQQQIPFTPIMNELTNPWTLWNAEPDFDSHRFDEVIDPAVAEAPNYTLMTQGSLLGSAADFEILIRASVDRLINARMRARRDDADLDKALGLLRPMFCDETVNYASERHDSGEVTTAIVIDDAIRYLYLSIRPDNWPYAWLNDGRMRLASLENAEAPLAVMPVRGEATLQMEVGLVARNALSAEQVLAVRALDWQRPVFSEFRCGLYERGADRLRSNPPDLTQYSKVSDALAPVLDELMRLEVQDPSTGETVVWDIRPAAGTVVSVQDATDPAALEALTYGLFDEFEVDLDGFAAELEVWFDAMQEPGRRTELEAERQRRGCFAVTNYPSAPDVPDIDCSN